MQNELLKQINQRRNSELMAKAEKTLFRCLQNEGVERNKNK